MTRAAWQRTLAAVLPLSGIVLTLVGLFLSTDGSVVREPPEPGRAVVFIPGAIAPARAVASGPTADRRVRTGAGGRDEVLTCGVWLPAEADGKPAADAVDAWTRSQQAEVESVVLRRLEASDDPRERAAALRQRMWSARARAMAAYVATLEAPAGSAPTSATAMSAGAVSALPDPAQEALLRMALVTREPEIYAMALASCRWAGPPRVVTKPAACSLLSAAQWARLDGDNGAPWLARADEAAAEGDRAAESEALWRAGRASRHESGLGSSVRHLLRHAPDDEAHAMGVFAATVQALNMSISEETSAAQTLLVSCSQTALSDPQRRDVCAALAEHLVEKGGTLRDLAIGMGIGRRAGWSPERLAALGAAQTALRDATPLPVSDDRKDPSACGFVQAMVAHVRRLGRLGEVGALRSELAARERSPLPGQPLR